MKVLLMGDASNYHATLAGGLRALGHDVTLASDGSRWMRTGRDIDLSRHGSKLGGALLWARLCGPLRARLSGYDIVQLVSPGFARLRPERLMVLFERLRNDNGAVFMTDLGTDSSLVRDLTGPNPALRYSEWHGPAGLRPWAFTPAARRNEWLAKPLADYTDAVYAGVRGIVTALYEYDAVAARQYPDVPRAYGGIPIDTASLQPGNFDFGAPLRVLYAAHRGREAEKGADVLLRLLEKASEMRPGRIIIDRPANMPYARFVEYMRGCPVVCDQLYSFTPATTALLAMAMGAVAITGGEPEYYDFIGEKELRPVFNPDPDDFEGTLRRFIELADSPADLTRMSAQARTFVRLHNDAAVVARRFSDFWEETLRTGSR